ncbi:MAG: diiron oxygenase [Proteobacteria bacterium]|nr:diiron oxygenase [Pseudomonadota bacterium]
MDFYNDTMSESLGDRYLESWDKRSTIRTLAKRVLSNPDQQLFFPKHEQPICSHPLITSLGIKVQKQILTQTAYKFMLGISEHETRVVTTAIQRSICGNMSLPHTLRQALQTVIIDESYHAMVAFDFIQQVQAVTGEEALSFPKDSDLGSAVALTLENLPTSMHDSFTMIAVCIAENLITQELIAQQPDPDVNPFFYEINRDHLADEGRHAKLFTEVVNFVWSGLLQVERQRIADELPAFIERWMKRKVSAECDRVILRSLSLTEDEVEKVIDDTHPDLDFKCAAEINPHIMHIQKWLRRVGVWQSQKNLWDLSPIERIPNHDSHDALVPSAADTSDGIISSTTVCRLLSAAISKDPLHLAIRAHNHLTTYEDLNRHLSALSFTLVKAGLTSGCRLCLHLIGHHEGRLDSGAIANRWTIGLFGKYSRTGRP